MKKPFSIAAASLTLIAIAPMTVASVGMNAPKGMAFDSAGNLFVANPDTGRIFKFAPDGRRSTFASGLNHPYGIAFDPNGNLFVADAEDKGGQVLKFTPNGQRSTFASELVKPLFLTFDSAGISSSWMFTADIWARF